jgi:hypothetical protein
MRTTRVAGVLAVAAVLALSVLAAPALAKEKPVFGKFKATIAGSAHGIGEAGEMSLGPYHFEECEKELRSQGSVTMGESETFFQEVKFKKCETSRPAGGGLEETVYASFDLGMEFHSNGSMKLGPSAVTFQATNSLCEVTIPAQWVPAGAETEKGQERLWESGIEYSNEKEKSETKKFGEFRERLDIEWEVKGVRTTVKLTPECKYNGGHKNAAGEAEFNSGRLEGELEEITLGGGNLSFVEPL